MSRITASIPEKWLPVSWQHKPGRLFLSEIRIETVNRMGVLAAVSAAHRRHPDQRQPRHDRAARRGDLGACLRAGGGRPQAPGPRHARRAAHAGRAARRAYHCHASHARRERGRSRMRGSDPHRLTQPATIASRSNHAATNHPDRRCAQGDRHLLAGRARGRHGLYLGTDPARSGHRTAGQRRHRGRDPPRVRQPQGHRAGRGRLARRVR